MGNIRCEPRVLLIPDRMRQREAIAPEDREDYVPMTRTSPNIFSLDPRAEEAPLEEDS